MNIEKGMELYTLNVGNASRNRKQELTKRTVTKVGRKYFYLSSFHGREIKFYIDTLREVTDYVSRYQIYFTEKEWLEEKEAIAIYDKINKTYFSSYGRASIPLDKLRKIEEILGED